MPDLIPGAVLTLDVEKAVAGGRMLARHEGRVVLVAGAIPGETVRARVDRVVAHTAQAEVVEVLDASPDRRQVAGERGCGGQVLAHVVYGRQCRLKAEILQDACSRIGRLPLDRPDVVPSPEHGYRMRARLHGHAGRLGFHREGTHQICDAEATGQLLPATVAWVRNVESLCGSGDLDVAAVELTENVAGTGRACHLELRRPPRHAAIESLAGGAQDAVSWSLDPRSGWGTEGRTESARSRRRQSPGRGSQSHVSEDAVVHGDAALVDAVHPGDGAPPVALRRHARAFFQGNRFLLDPLVQHVVAAAVEGPVLDLYAGVGLFGLSAAAAGRGQIVLVEGDAVSGADLLENAAPFAGATVWPVPVEDFLGSAAATRHTPRTVIVDPPRTGMLPDVARAIIALAPRRVVFVSCDPATFARDARVLADAGFSLSAVTLFDLFPGTAHVESVGIFDRAG